MFDAPISQHGYAGKFKEINHYLHHESVFKMHKMYFKIYFNLRLDFNKT